MKRMILPVFKKYKKLLISVMLVSAMGCGFMSGLSSAHTSLQVSLESYVEDYQYPDVMITTDVTDQSTAEKLRKLEEVSAVNARLCGDTYLKSPQGRFLSVRVFSYHPDDRLKFHYWSQAHDDSMDEVLLEYNFAEDNGIRAGDTVEVKVDQEFRRYFIAGIVTNPETLSVQPTEDSWGANTDFGYAYAPIGLLTKEYEQKYSEAKEELDGKQEELDAGWKDSEEKLAESQQKLEEAKKQLEESKKKFEDSSAEAQKKLEQLNKSEQELLATRNDLNRKREELAKTRETLSRTLQKLQGRELTKAADGLQEIDEALRTIEEMTALAGDPQVRRLVGLMKAYPDMEMADLLRRAGSVEAFLEKIASYGFVYDGGEPVSAAAERLLLFREQLMEDVQFLESDAFGDLSSLQEADREKLTALLRRYHLDDERLSLEENVRKAQRELGDLQALIEENHADMVIALLPQSGEEETMQEMLSGLQQMTKLYSELSGYAGEPVKTAGDFVRLYEAFPEEAERQKQELTKQRKELLNALSGYGVSEEDLSDLPAFQKAKEQEMKEGLSRIDSGIAEIDSGLRQIEEGLGQISAGREKISSTMETAEAQIQSAEQQISAGEEKYLYVRSRTLSKLWNLKGELEKAYQQLEEGEGYDQLCNQFLVYVRDGTDKAAALDRLKAAVNEEGIEIKSSFTYEQSAVRKRITDNLQTIETLSVLMPAVFFVIILIVAFLFMSLIIKQSRREIGILRALGFTKGDIRALYCGVNAVTSLCAILIGMGLGAVLTMAVGAYFRDFFPLAEYTYRPNLVMVLLSIVLTIVVGQIATLISTGSIAGIMPSEAMSRPAPDTAEVPVLLEKLLVRASPMTKFSVTTLIRNKMRFVFSVVCMAASVMMIFSALSFITSKNAMLQELYGERIRYDCQIFFKEEPDEAFLQELSDLHAVHDVQQLPYFQSEIEYGGKKQKTVINAVSRDTKLLGIYNGDHEPISVPEEGIILEKHIAQALGVGPGDTVSVGGPELTVAAVSEQSISRFQYVSYETSEKLGTPAIGSVICQIGEEDEQELIAFLVGNKNYLYSVFTRLALQGNEKTFKTYDLAAWIIIGFAILIGLIIVINTAQTNLLEKKRELCVLRTLGFQHREVSRKWFVQSFLQFIFSCLIGLPSGILIAKFALQHLGNDTREYLFANSLKEYLFTILLVLFYVVVSHLIAMHAMKQWDLVESVKDKE